MIPPFGFMTALILSGSSKSKTEMYGKKIVQSTKITENLSILGPVEAPIFLLRGKYRFRILIKGNSRKMLNNLTKSIIQSCPTPSSIKIIIDVDPYSFMWFTHIFK